MKIWKRKRKRKYKNKMRESEREKIDIDIYLEGFTFGKNVIKSVYCSKARAKESFRINVVTFYIKARVRSSFWLCSNY